MLKRLDLLNLRSYDTMCYSMPQIDSYRLSEQHGYRSPLHTQLSVAGGGSWQEEQKAAEENVPLVVWRVRWTGEHLYRAYYRYGE